jgi:hypothetical protein
VVTVYPHRDSVPVGTWVRLLGSAGREVGVLADLGFLLAEDSALVSVLAERAGAGVLVRVCFADLVSDGPEPEREQAGIRSIAEGLRDGPGAAEIRLRLVGDYNTICYADDDLIVVQHVYGLPAGEAPVLRLRRAGGGDMTRAYLGSFERIWAGARPVT